VALDGSSIAGTGTLVGRNIEGFCLADRQGKGLGGRIMGELEKKAAEVHIDLVELDPSMLSVDFYHPLGYKGDERSYIKPR
jgi:GNAT superfamily N-acetyltransferase